MFYKQCYRIVLDIQCLITKQYVRHEQEVFGLKEAKALISNYKSRQKSNISLLATIYNEYDERVYDDFNVTNNKGIAI